MPTTSCDHRIAFAKGDVVFRQGEPARYWFEVVSGCARLCHYFGDGRRQVTLFPTTGDVFGIERGLRQFSADALTDLILLRHRQLDNHEDRAPDPGWACALQRALKATERTMRLFSQPNACRRIGAFLLDLLERSDSGDRIDLPMNRQDLADHLGLTMHTVSRSISSLVKRGFLIAESPAVLRIADRTAFEEFVGIDWIEPDCGPRLVA